MLQSSLSSLTPETYPIGTLSPISPQPIRRVKHQPALSPLRSNTQRTSQSSSVPPVPTRPHHHHKPFAILRNLDHSPPSTRSAPDLLLPKHPGPIPTRHTHHSNQIIAPSTLRNTSTSTRTHDALSKPLTAPPHPPPKTVTPSIRAPSTHCN